MPKDEPYNNMLVSGKCFFDTETASFSNAIYYEMAMRKFQEKCPEALFLTTISPNGYIFVRCENEEHNQNFMVFLRVKFDGACTLHDAKFF